VGLGGCVNPVAISQLPNGGDVYVACNGGGGVAVVTASDNVLLSPVAAFSGSAPVWIDSSSDGKYTFVANQGSSTVSVICTSSDITVCPVGNTEIVAPPVGGAPTFLKYDAHSQHVYVAGAGFVSIIDASGITPTFSVLKTLTGTERTCGCAFGETWVTALPDGTRFYVSDQAGKSVSVYSASNFAFIKSISLVTTAELSTTPIMIDSDKNSTKVYTANTGSNDFSIIRTSDDTEVFPGSTGGATSGRVVPPKRASCADGSTDLCRQIPTYVVVLP
jgi:DNA-binding beta-propeller fold protein YncE